MLRVAGVRINPRTNGVHGAFYFARFALKKLPDGAEVVVDLPSGARVGGPRWSPNGRSFAFTNITDRAIELWVCDVATAKAHRIDGVKVNPVLGGSGGWLPDQTTLLRKSGVARRPAPGAEASTPVGPRLGGTGSRRPGTSHFEATH